MTIRFVMFSRRAGFIAKELGALSALKEAHLSSNQLIGENLPHCQSGVSFKVCHTHRCPDLQMWQAYASMIESAFVVRKIK